MSERNPGHCNKPGCRGERYGYRAGVDGGRGSDIAAKWMNLILWGLDCTWHICLLYCAGDP